MERSLWCVTISQHSLEQFIDMYHLHSDITLMMLAMLLSIFMDLALKRKTNAYRLLQPGICEGRACHCDWFPWPHELLDTSKQNEPPLHCS